MMETKIGEKSVPFVGQGTYGYGGYFDRESQSTDNHVQALRYGISLGMTLIDTAEIYASGMAEEIVGKAISGLERDSIFLATKVWRNHMDYDGVISSCKKSIARMNVKNIDLYQIHWPDEYSPLNETLRAFEKLVDDGLVENIGVSNFSVSDLKKAMDALSRHEIKSNQMSYSLDYRKIESHVLPFCKENKIAVMAYSPLGTGDIFHGRKAKVLSELGAKYNKTMAQIALNWIVSKGVIAIPKAFRREHIDENSRASDFKLSESDIEYLERA